eukprot:CAMPEP_0180032770 /NCGR_PEP_ID=MMETSP0984-20121128/28650_1 /TAXON_ID=483367 /ORGANISM="non described non described, Strain CCMP 2436" /LENGTH=51 /DNA_ID=CAMNT_0021958059 /DNA_START=151 /DNA_END=306 /DNA_ORIENTATION=+
MTPGSRAWAPALPPPPPPRARARSATARLHIGPSQLPPAPLLSRPAWSRRF